MNDYQNGNQYQNNNQYQGGNQYYNQPYQNQYSAQPVYNTVYQQPVKKTSSAATAALIFGIIAFFFNPMYIPSFVAIITGIIGISAKPSNKSSAVVGLILGIVFALWQVILDIILLPFTFGLSFFF